MFPQAGIGRQPIATEQQDAAITSVRNVQVGQAQRLDFACRLGGDQEADVLEAAFLIDVGPMVFGPALGDHLSVCAHLPEPHPAACRHGPQDEIVDGRAARDGPAREKPPQT